jgi:hypothetical protein
MNKKRLGPSSEKLHTPIRTFRPRSGPSPFRLDLARRFPTGDPRESNPRNPSPSTRERSPVTSQPPRASNLHCCLVRVQEPASVRLAAGEQRACLSR